MKILIVKMSSMGDVVHTLPAISDALSHQPALNFHWLVEKSFSEIPKMHQGIAKVIPITLRAWRKNWLQALKSKAPQKLIRQLKAENYDLIIDAQGLFKSAIISKLICAPIYGYDKKSIREPLASFFYQKRFSISKKEHAISRIRALFAKTLNYSMPDSMPNYQLSLKNFDEKPAINLKKPYLVFLHNTTWQTKHWPESYWQKLTKIVTDNGFSVILTSGNDKEYQRAMRLQKDNPFAHALKRQSIKTIAFIIENAHAVISVDTGFAQLTAAFDIPNISLFGPTNPKLSKPFGKNQHVLVSSAPCAPCLKKRCPLPTKPEEVQPACFHEITPEKVWQTLNTINLPPQALPTLT